MRRASRVKSEKREDGKTRRASRVKSEKREGQKTRTVTRKKTWQLVVLSFRTGNVSFLVSFGGLVSMASGLS